MVLIEFPSHIASRPSSANPISQLHSPAASRRSPSRPDLLPSPRVHPTSAPSAPHASTPSPPHHQDPAPPVSRPHRALPSGSCGLKSEGKGWRGRALPVGSYTWGAQFYSPDPRRLSCPYVSFLTRPRIQVNTLAFLPISPSLSLIPLIWLPSSLSSLR
jgi:hypothetical protein